jgi:hypothetical protein
MNITLTPAQENLVQSKISTGRYRSMQEVIEMAGKGSGDISTNPDYMQGYGQ